MTSTELTLEQYAGIIAALAEGHALAAVLAQEGVSGASWPVLDASFKQRLARDPALLGEYTAHVHRAEDVLTRGVAPLAEDPVAYLAFVAHLAAADPRAVLGAHGLTLADISRLGRSWERRFKSDEGLRQRAQAQAQRVAPPDRIRVEPAELRPFSWTPRASEPVYAHGGVLPTCGEDPLERTLDPARLPSAFGAKAPERAWNTARELEPVPALRGTIPHPGGPAGPATPFRGRSAAPAAIAATLEPHAELGATAPVTRLEPCPALADTAPLGAAPPTPPTPFQGEHPPPPSVLLAPHPELGETARAAPRPPPAPPTPFRAQPPLEPNPAMARTHKRGTPRDPK